MNVRPSLLTVYETHFVPLGERLVPGLPGFLSGVLPGLEEGSDHFDRYYYLLMRVKHRTSTGYIYARLCAYWKVKHFIKDDCQKLNCMKGNSQGLLSSLVLKAFWVLRERLNSNCVSWVNRYLQIGKYSQRSLNAIFLKRLFHMQMSFPNII